MALFLLTETLEALEETVWLEKNEIFPNFLISIKLCLFSTTSLAINGFICEVLVNCGWPKSIV